MVCVLASTLGIAHAQQYTTNPTAVLTLTKVDPHKYITFQITSLAAPALHTRKIPLTLNANQAPTSWYDAAADTRIKETIANEMITLGYDQDPFYPDLVVYFDIEKNTADHALFISIIDRKENKILWQGTAPGITQNDPIEKDHAIQKAITKTFTGCHLENDLLVLNTRHLIHSKH